MYQLRQLIQGITHVLGGGLLVMAIVFAETRQRNKTCLAIDLTIDSMEEPPLVTQKDVLQQLTENHCLPMIGMPMQALASKKIENILQSHTFVRQGRVYKNWQGTLKIRVLPRRPIARILYAHQQRQYIDQEGTFLPWSAHYTARVLLIDAANLSGITQNLLENAYGTALLALLNYIDIDPFWRAQIAHMCIDQKGNIIMYTQISQQCIVFGQPEDITRKFKKLQCFYQKIIPYKGWNTYKRVSLEFDKQIVCE